MKRIIFAFCVVASVLSCTKQAGSVSEPSGRTVTLSVNCDAAAARVMLNSSLQTVWNQGDSVSVFYAGTNVNNRALFTGSDGATTGDITFQYEASNDDETGPQGITYAVIPYRPGNRLSDRVLHSKIPAVQHYNGNSYDPKSVLLFASSSDNSLTFRYACAVLCLEVKAGGTQPLTINSITLASAAGEDIAGGVAVDMLNPMQPSIALEGETSPSVVLCSATGADMCTVEAGSSKKFYFCVAPVALSQGYVFNVRLSDKETILVRNTAAKSLEAASLLGIECSISPSVSIIIDFDTTFSPELPSTNKTPGVNGDTYTFTNAAASGGQYSITSYSVYRRLTASGHKCLRFDSSGSCLLLPSIPGMRLRSMKARVMTSQASKPMSIASTKGSGAGDVVPRTDFIAGEMTAAVSYAAADTPLYLHTHSVNTQIESIELYFE